MSRSSLRFASVEMKPRFLILLVVFNVIWAGSLSAYKALEPFLDVPGIVTLRFGLAALGFMVLWPWLPGIAPRGRDLVRTCVMGGKELGNGELEIRDLVI